MRRVIILILIFLGIYFIFTWQVEAGEVVNTLKKGDLRWLILAVIVHLAYLLNIGASLRAIYNILGMEERIERLTLLAAAANFVVVVAPSAGMGGIAIFAADAQQRGHPTGRASTAAAVYVFFDYLATLVVVFLGLFILFQRNKLREEDVVATFILLCLALGLGTLLYLGMKSGERLGKALARIGSLANRITKPFLKREYFDLSKARGFGIEAAEGLHNARQSPGDLWLPFALGLSTKTLMMAILFLMFMAFNQPFSVGTLVAGFSVGYLFTIVSPTPSGIGFVETAMTLALTSLRVPLAAAALIVFGYRGFTLWLTMGYGMLAMRWVAKPTSEGEA
jgi:uncharacterized protein (TIRG00374 family)